MSAVAHDSCELGFVWVQMEIEWGTIDENGLSVRSALGVTRCVAKISDGRGFHVSGAG